MYGKDQGLMEERKEGERVVVRSYIISILLITWY